jgi:hypothetical protein
MKSEEPQMCVRPKKDGIDSFVDPMKPPTICHTKTGKGAGLPTAPHRPKKQVRGITAPVGLGGDIDDFYDCRRVYRLIRNGRSN